LAPVIQRSRTATGRTTRNANTGASSGQAATIAHPAQVVPVFTYCRISFPSPLHTSGLSHLGAVPVPQCLEGHLLKDTNNFGGPKAKSI
jgi:hypothetical protein